MTLLVKNCRSENRTSSEFCLASTRTSITQKRLPVKTTAVTTTAGDVSIGLTMTETRQPKKDGRQVISSQITKERSTKSALRTVLRVGRREGSQLSRPKNSEDNNNCVRGESAEFKTMRQEENNKGKTSEI